MTLTIDFFLQYLSQQIFNSAKTFEDQLETLFLAVNAIAKVDIPKAINKALSVLSNLGEEFAESYTESDTKLILEETKRPLDQFTGDMLLAHRTMTDRSKIMTMKFLSRLELIFLIAKPSVLPIVTAKHVQLTMKHGLSPQSPLGIMYFGMHLASLGDISKGYKHAKLGMKLSKKEGYKEVAGECIMMGTHVACFVEPLQSAVETFLDGELCTYQFIAVVLFFLLATLLFLTFHVCCFLNNLRFFKAMLLHYRLVT